MPLLPSTSCRWSRLTDVLLLGATLPRFIHARVLGGVRGHTPYLLHTRAHVFSRIHTHTFLASLRFQVTPDLPSLIKLLASNQKQERLSKSRARLLALQYLVRVGVCVFVCVCACVCVGACVCVRV